MLCIVLYVVNLKLREEYIVKEKLLNIGMMVATIPLIVLAILAILLGGFSPALLLGSPFIILGIIILFLKSKQNEKKETI